MSTVIDRFLPVHTRYTTKEEEREKQQKVEETRKSKPSRRVDIEVDHTSATRCSGALCNQNNLYNQSFGDDLLFGKE